MTHLVSSRPAVFALALGLVSASACGVGAAGNSKATQQSSSSGQTTTTTTPTTTVTNSQPSTTAANDPNVYNTPRYALRGRFSPGDSNVLAPQIMSWGHTSVVARVTHTTQVTVSMTDVQGSGAYSLSAANESTGTVSTASFDPNNGSGSLTGLDASAVYAITFTKHVEPMYSTAVFTGFTLDANAGYLNVAAASARRMEVFGDSISAGYGDLGASATCNAAADNEDAELAYGPVAAATLGADLHVAAWSGKGVYENNGGSTTETLPDIWRRADATDANSVWDTTRWIPQVVVINLGTNDFTNTSVDQTTFVQTYANFLATLRTAYPSAAVIVSIGPMLQGTELSTCVAYLQQAIDERNAAGDTNLFLLQYAVENTNTGAGCAYHPNVTTQANMAAALVAKINSVVQW